MKESTDTLIAMFRGAVVWAVVGDWDAGRFLLPEIDLCGSPLTLGSGCLTRQKTWLSTVTFCPTGPAARGHPLKGGRLLSHGRNRRGPEGSSCKADVRRWWDPRVEKRAGTPCLEEKPILSGCRHRLSNLDG